VNPPHETLSIHLKEALKKVYIAYAKALDTTFFFVCWAL
jgi:hypothetical protein